MKNDLPVILSLDAGGTNFVFSAVRNGNLIGETVRKNSYGDDIEKSLKIIVEGFHQVKDSLKEEISAISFAFPGPSDFENGVIGDLWNLPGYRGGIALAPMLEKEFNVPVFINNDGDLFAFGEYMGGALPYINQKLSDAGNSKVYKNLTGITLGTGFGLGIVNRGHLLRGDNSMPAEIWLMRGYQYPDAGIEESVSIRGIQRSYRKYSGLEKDISPKEIYEVAKNTSGKAKKAALNSFRDFGINLGEAVASLISLFDSNVVIGGGLSKSWDLFAPYMMQQLRSYFDTPEHKKIPRLTHTIYNLEKEKDFKSFLKEDEKLISIPGGKDRVHPYNKNSVAGVILSINDTSESIIKGAYFYALKEMGYDIN